MHGLRRGWSRTTRQQEGKEQRRRRGGNPHPRDIRGIPRGDPTAAQRSTKLFFTSHGHLSFSSSSASTSCLASHLPPNSALILQTLAVPSPRTFVAPEQILASLQGAVRGPRQHRTPTTETRSWGSLLGHSNIHQEASLMLSSERHGTALCIKRIAEACFSGGERWSTQEVLSVSQETRGYRTLRLKGGFCPSAPLC